MTDLLPLVTAVLNDRAALDAQREIRALQKELKATHAVEVLRAGDGNDVVVHASASFEEGSYGDNPNLWQVNLRPSSSICRLADLRQCSLCVGGGFPMASFDDDLSNRPDYEGILDDDDDGSEDKAIRFCFCPYSTWVTVVVRGWPRRGWEHLLHNNDIDPENTVEFLVDTVAVSFPEATIEFHDVSFVTRHIPGALKRLLTPARASEVRADLEARDIDDDFGDFVHHIMRGLREAGVGVGAFVFRRHVGDILEILRTDFSTTELNDDTQPTIDALVEAHAEVGPNGTEAVVQQARARLVELNQDDESDMDVGGQ